METDIVDIVESLIRAGPKIPCDYPDGEAGEFLKDHASQPLSLLFGAIAMYGSDDPWALPHAWATRLGKERFDATSLAEESESALILALKQRPALHMDPVRMGRWASQAAKVIVGQYGGGTSWIWNDYRHIDVSRLVMRLRGIPGIGAVKALVFAFLLYRDWGATVVGWDKFEIPMDPPMLETLRRLGIGAFPSGDPEQTVKIHEGLRTIAKKHCIWNGPQCGACPVSAKCPKQGV
jgi:hypothetical protein